MNLSIIASGFVQASHRSFFGSPWGWTVPCSEDQRQPLPAAIWETKK